MKIALPTADVIVGRQAITFGKAYFWNPLDIYLPFDPAQVDRDYKAGVDALRVDIPMGLFSGMTLIYVLGRELDLRGQYVDDDGTWDASWYGSSLLGRGFTNLKGWDLAVQCGKIYGGWHMGMGLIGEIKKIQLRAEAAHFRPEDSPPLPEPFGVPLLEKQFTAVMGLGRRFQNSLDIQFEFLYNGGGESDDINTGFHRLQTGRIIHAGRWLGGLTASYELTPLITGQLAVIRSFSDRSTQIQPTLTWSLSDNSELIIGASLNRGRRPTLDGSGNPFIRSEFGTYPHSIFAEFKIYF